MYMSLWSFFQRSVCYWHSVPVIMKLLLNFCVLLTFGTRHYEALSSGLCATVILYLTLWRSFHISVCYCHNVPVIMKFFPQLCVQRAFCACHYVAHSTALCATYIRDLHYEALSTALCSSDFLYLLLWSSFHSSICYWHPAPVLWSSFHSSVCYWHSADIIMELLLKICVLLTFSTCHYEVLSTAVCHWLSIPVILKLLPQLCVLLTFCSCHYEAPSTALCVTNILYLSLWNSLHSYLCYRHSVPVFMNLFQQLSVMLKFCTWHYEAPSTVLCATDIMFLSLWSYFHSSVCYCHFLPVIMKILPQLFVQQTSCTSFYEVLSTALCATDILYLSLWSYFQSSVWYLHSVPLIMKLLPQLCMLLSFCTCHYEANSTALCATDILYLSLWSSFHNSVCYWYSVPLFVKLFLRFVCY